MKNIVRFVMTTSFVCVFETKYRVWTPHQKRHQGEPCDWTGEGRPDIVLASGDSNMVPIPADSQAPAAPAAKGICLIHFKVHFTFKTFSQISFYVSSLHLHAVVLILAIN